MSTHNTAASVLDAASIETLFISIPANEMEERRRVCAPYDLQKPCVWDKNKGTSIRCPWRL